MVFAPPPRLSSKESWASRCHFGPPDGSIDRNPLLARLGIRRRPSGGRPCLGNPTLAQRRAGPRSTAMLPPKRSLVVRILAARPRKHNSGGLPPRSFVLFSVRRQAEAGLLRDGGMTSAEVSRYIRELRLE